MPRVLVTLADTVTLNLLFIPGQWPQPLPLRTEGWPG